MFWEEPAATSDTYDVDHSIQVYAFDGRTDESLILWNGIPNPVTITEDLVQLAESL